ncbi:outer membrane protein assembly factor BamB family protein [Alicyclobacillus mengziensis]|uniref:PQQ-binding-like beta-propeller repeat protein n=1 Tax=Alicyclobacillus mengziensis TaxID=2931921 RepID=A0A9X7VW82_9BACL|nr:PQQ-binding-like beta-propeller repeat protein [Alicyclobacillus mengziensis]QSO45672.1 PQQ-binding-like beta-propeller repeat protein [Alicyclobacillus mengziensis]
MKSYAKFLILSTGLLTAFFAVAGCGSVASTVTQKPDGQKPGKASGQPIQATSSGPPAGSPANSGTAGSPSSGRASSSGSALPGLSYDWPTFGNNLWQNRVSPIARTVPNPKQHWSLQYSLPVSAGGGSESFPLEQDGILYFTTMQARVIAMDAATGRVLWTYAPKLHLLQGIPTINRGVALGDGKVFVLTADDRLIALSQSTGSLIYQVTVADEAKGYFESMAPLYVNGKVFVGSAGGDEGVRGFEACYDAATGALIWQTYTVPKRGQGWLPSTGQHGGGAVWNVPAYDPATQQLFFGTGNPSPDFFGASRPGPDPMTDAVVSVQSATGQVNWYQQEVTHDLWDYDVASPPMLFSVGGQLAVGEAGKDGKWYEWYAKTGKPVFAPIAFVKQRHSPPTATPTLEWPGSDGGANYGPSAYNPAQHTVLITGINGPEYLRALPTSHTGYRVDDGTSAQAAPVGDWRGTLTCIDTQTGKVVWQNQLATPAIGGVTTTVGGTAYFGEANGWLYGVDVYNGKTVWAYHAGIPAGSAPIVYKTSQQVYLTYVLGQSGSLQGLFPYQGETRILTFRLGQ